MSQKQFSLIPPPQLLRNVKFFIACRLYKRVGQWAIVC